MQWRLVPSCPLVSPSEKGAKGHSEQNNGLGSCRLLVSTAWELSLLSLHFFLCMQTPFPQDVRRQEYVSHAHGAQLNTLHFKVSSRPLFQVSEVQKHEWPTKSSFLRQSPPQLCFIFPYWNVFCGWVIDKQSLQIKWSVSLCSGSHH